jgi:hypothetical protein
LIDFACSHAEDPIRAFLFGNMASGALIESFGRSIVDELSGWHHAHVIRCMAEAIPVTPIVFMVARASQIQECMVLADFVHLQDRRRSRIEYVDIIVARFRCHFRLVGIFGVISGGMT